MGLFDKAKEALSGNADKADDAVDKAGDFADDKTGGKYSDQIDKGTEAVKDRLPGQDDNNQA